MTLLSWLTLQKHADTEKYSMNLLIYVLKYTVNVQKHARICSFVPYKCEKCVKQVLQRHNRPAAITPIFHLLCKPHAQVNQTSQGKPFEQPVKIHCLSQDVPKIDALSISLLFKTHQTSLCASILGMRRLNPPVRPKTVKTAPSLCLFSCVDTYICVM